MTIGDRIRKQREIIEMSQTDLAERVKISKQTLYKYETNVVTNIPSDKIEAIAKVLSVSPAYLMGWSEETADDKFSLDSTILAATVAKTPELKQLITYYQAADETGKQKIMENAADMARLYPHI